MKGKQIYDYIFAATCPALSLESGEVEYMPDPVNGEYPTGAYAVFRCNDEYMRTGTLVSICQDLGNWEPDIPTCDEGIAVYTLFLHIKIINCYSFVVYIFKGIFSTSCLEEKT